MPIHDLHCDRCNRKRYDVKIVGDAYPLCECGARMDWTPTRFQTDVRGSEQVSGILDEAPGVPLRYSSTRERERKMRAMNYEPAGDKVGGARNEDRYRGTIFVDGKRDA